jgi:hypothetical protein
MGKPQLTVRAVRRHRLRDICIIGVSVYVAVALEQTGAIDHWIASASDFSILGSFIAGIFFTSLFTTAPAIVALGELSISNPLLSVALPATLGALIGDLFLFTFVRDSVAQDLRGIARTRFGKALLRIFAHPYLHWFVPFIGALIIASPLPDELGLAMLGLTRARFGFVIPVSIAMNFLGVILIGLAARAL